MSFGVRIDMSMKAILICPEHRPAGGLFQRMKPLALMPVAGRSLLDRTLAELKREGVEEVVVLASDRPERVRKAVGQGKAWGLKVEVRGVRAELMPEVAEAEHGGRRRLGEARPLVRVLESVPEMVPKPLWMDNQSTFEMLLKAVQDPRQAAQVTMQEQSPGVWISTKAQVSRKAHITAPAWIGPHACVREGAQVGPEAVIERGAFIDCYATVTQAWIGPDTYLGKDLGVQNAMAWGQGLLSIPRNSFVEVRDAFMMSDLAGHSHLQSRATMVERLIALLLLLITLPKALGVMLKGVAKGEDCFDAHRVVMGPMARVDSASRTWALSHLQGANGLFQRWPELWEVVCGRLALVGNRPLTLEQCTALRGTLGELWLKQASGVFSLADAHGESGAGSPEKARAHAAYFSANRTLGLRLWIFSQCLRSFLFPGGARDFSVQKRPTVNPTNPIQAIP
jgi:hypothetical protein